MEIGVKENRIRYSGDTVNKKLRPDFAEQSTSLPETVNADSCSVSYTMVHSNITRPVLNRSPVGISFCENKNESFNPKLL